MNLQRSLRKPVSFRGVGLHTGREIQVTIRPAPVDAGVVFHRTDLPGHVGLPAVYQNVSSTQFATTLGSGKGAIGTVEHLLAALHGSGVDNARIEVDGPEVPVLDGSAEPYCRAIAAAGVENQLRARKLLVLRKRIEVRLAEKWAVAEPSDTLSIHASIDWDHPSIGFQEFSYFEGVTHFSEIATARTFGFLRDLEALRKMGLARGGALECAVVLDDALVLNPEGLRFPDEFVRHKILDALGDLKLAGMQIAGSFRLHRAGHALHNQLLVAIFSNPENYEIVSEKTAASKRKQIARVPAYARA